MQIIVTDLSQQADGHVIQSRIFASKGLSKLAKKYEEHAIEEREYVEKCIDRLLDLGIEVKKEAKVFTDPIEWVKYDLQVSKNGLAWVKELFVRGRSYYICIPQKYYQNEKKDMNWGAQLEIIEVIGKQNWILQQM